VRFTHSLVGFSQLQGFTKHFTGWEFQHLPGFSPLQRYHRRTGQKGFQTFQRSIHRFSQPLDEYPPCTTCRFIPPCWRSEGLTFRALQQTDWQPSSDNHTSSTLSAFHSFLPALRRYSHIPTITALSVTTNRKPGPCSPAGVASILGLDRP
jgi:hypothetical protein